MIRVTVENFEKEILNSSRVCVVVFKSDGCHLCQNLNPAIGRLRDKYSKHFKFAEVDASEQTQLMEVLDVDGVPTIWTFTNEGGVQLPYPEQPDPDTGYYEKLLDKYLALIVKKTSELNNV